jgi:hypothetical protein
MKKPSNPKNSSAKKTTVKAKETGELKKVSKLKPLKEKEKKGWKNSIGDEDEEDFAIEDDIKLNNGFDDDDEDESGDFYDDSF